MLSKLNHYLTSTIRYLNQPHLIPLRRQGVMVDTFLRLNQPWFREQEFATILDIGANEGNFALTLHNVLPKAQIFSFEPLPECFERLQARMAGIPNFAAFNIGLGDQQSELPFQRNVYSSSSSFLTMTDTHKSAFPQASQSQTIKVPIETLDQVATRIHIARPLLVKVDVQGYEERVLRGGKQTISHADLIFIETSFASLYEGQLLFDGIYAMLTEWGFKYGGSLEQHVDRQTGKVLQEDSVFYRV